ncbi:ribosome biogenesis GTPase Der [Bacteroidia bacterium]|nr:ribosome biogenesis GTPase Der [Bacteroidia bacterium]MDC1395912.1 ribosome biogenesis GTPase Der [Bacteroidia bacterium]
MAGIVAIVGRPNVGKSTLFNRLIGERKAIVDNVSGVTRDRHYGKSDWIGTEFTVVDTGGYVKDSKDIFEMHIREQVELAIAEADVLLFMVDAVLDPNDLDVAFAQIVRESGKPYLVVANKADNDERMFMANSYYSLGINTLYPISSLSGSGTGELLDDLVPLLPEGDVETEENIPKIAFVGRPNAGKSTFCNTLLGEERNIVTDIPGTTRDTLFVRYKAFNNDLYLVDTAGVRKKSKVSEDIEFYSVMRSIRAIENVDVVALVIDATRGVESQDMNLFGLAQKNGKGVVIIINKWDLIDKDTHTAKEYEEMVKARIAPFTDVPILFVSALTKQRVLKALDTIMEVYQSMNTSISTSKLNDFFLPLIERTPPPSLKGKYIKIKYVTQLPTRCPSFAFFCNLPQYLPDSYKRFLENKLRANYNFTGIPLRIYFRKK